MTVKPLKTVQVSVCESCKFVDNSSSLKLLGTEKASEQVLKYTTQNLQLTQKDNSFFNNFDQDCCFYYQLWHFDGRNVLISEVGIGELQEVEGTRVINRKFALYNQTGENEVSPNPAFYTGVPQGEHEYLQVAHYPIQNAMQLFLNEHSIPYSSSNGPLPLIVEPNSLVGRLDGEIQNINITDLLTKQKKSVVVKSSKLPSKPAKGTLVIDSSDDKLKIYNGKVWRTIKYEDT